MACGSVIAGKVDALVAVIRALLGSWKQYAGRTAPSQNEAAFGRIAPASVCSELSPTFGRCVTHLGFTVAGRLYTRQIILAWFLTLHNHF